MLIIKNVKANYTFESMNLMFIPFYSLERKKSYKSRGNWSKNSTNHGR